MKVELFTLYCHEVDQLSAFPFRVHDLCHEWACVHAPFPDHDPYRLDDLAFPDHGPCRVVHDVELLVMNSGDLGNYVCSGHCCFYVELDSTHDQYKIQCHSLELS